MRRSYFFALIVIPPSFAGAGVDAAEAACAVSKSGTAVELRSPHFAFRLDTASGLRALSFENRRTGRTISLDGPELEVLVGAAGAPAGKPVWKVVSSGGKDGGSAAEASFELAASDPPLSARISYRWTAAEPVLRKTVEIANTGPAEVIVLDVSLGNYRTPSKAAVKEAGFPLYLDGEVFLGVAHPAGVAAAADGAVTLTRHPGRRLAPAAGAPAGGGQLPPMEAVIGAGERGKAREAFIAHLRGRMRRAVRGHDRPYAVFDNFGSWENDLAVFGQNSEARLLYSLDRLDEGQRATGCRFDICNIHFWVDHAGDLKRFDPVRFPRGFAPIREKLASMGVRPGLWIDSSMKAWSIGRNPATEPSTSDDPGFFCRASEPIRSMYRDAFRFHVRENGIRLIKFDNLRSVCNNPRHDHLPGIYSTEAITDSVIEFLAAVDAECPDVFLILYWGHRSPWWLLHGDTLFDSGIGIEAASPAIQPALRARDSVTQKLDQAQRIAADIPPLGKDSLGVWLSDWPWNSSIGKERWAEGVVLDMARGSLLVQLWADREWLSPPERERLADLIALVRARPECFANPRFIIGDPSRDEPYGYASTDGRRALLAIHNASWADAAIPLALGPSWGLPAGRLWDLYRRHPDPARLVASTRDFVEDGARLALRPFDIVLLEAVPAGEAPALGKPLPEARLREAFVEASRALEVKVKQPTPPAVARDGIWTVLRPRKAASAGGASLGVLADGSVLASGKNPTPDTWTLEAETDLSRITAVRLEVLPDPSLPSGGPGRAFNGNLALGEVRLEAAPRSGGAQASPFAFSRAAADFSQTSHGGFPVAAAIDGDPRTAWSIHPQEGSPHVAVLEIGKPADIPGGASLTFTLGMGYTVPGMPPDHAIGRLRLAVTGAPPPVPLPAGYGPAPRIVSLEAPPTKSGGLVAVAAEMRRGSEPVAMNDIGSFFSASARLGGAPVAAKPVLGNYTYPSAWQAWRIEVGPSAAPRPIEIEVMAKVQDLAFRAWFVPAGE
jgi:hypothetical protein